MRPALEESDTIDPADAGRQPNAPVPYEPLARLSSTAEVLIWQSRLRILVASTAAVAELLLLANAGASPDAIRVSAATVLLATAAYIVISASAAGIARRRLSVPGWVVSAIVGSDVALIFALTIAVSSPGYHERILIFAFFALHLNTFYLGRRHALAVIALTLAGYALLVRVNIGAGAPLNWAEEAWSMGAFLLASGVLLLEHGSLRNRLAAIIRLFGRAEEGDFSEAYDEMADRRPDAISGVGRAYNRVRGRLVNMVLTDALTGCVNRRGFDQALTREVARAVRARRDLALLALDLDHFKDVNDTHGHPAGDMVLREVGALLMHAARAGDVVARTGGEEFCFVLPDTSVAGAHQLASRLCQSLRSHAFAVRGGAVRLTVSIGIVAPDDLEGPVLEAAELLKARADEALYFAKRAGRDRVQLWTPPLRATEAALG